MIRSAPHPRVILNGVLGVSRWEIAVLMRRAVRAAGGRVQPWSVSITRTLLLKFRGSLKVKWLAVLCADDVGGRGMMNRRSKMMPAQNHRYACTEHTLHHPRTHETSANHPCRSAHSRAQIASGSVSVKLSAAAHRALAGATNPRL
jgi:hypothetical protein